MRGAKEGTRKVAMLVSIRVKILLPLLLYSHHRSLGLQLSDARVNEPQIRAHLMLNTRPSPMFIYVCVCMYILKSADGWSGDGAHTSRKLRLLRKDASMATVHSLHNKRFIPYIINHSFPIYDKWPECILYIINLLCAGGDVPTLIARSADGWSEGRAYTSRKMCFSRIDDNQGCAIGWRMIGYRTYRRSIGWWVMGPIGVDYCQHGHHSFPTE
jgi:hypothetical protein